MNDGTGSCKKCTTEIPLKAERCPQCGYEPGKPVLGPIGTILGGILLIGGVFQVLLGLFSLLTVFTGVPPSSAIVGGLVFVGAGGIQSTIANWLGKFGTHYAAEQPDETTASDNSKSFREKFQEGQERGDRIGERIGEKYKKRIDKLSPWVFTSTIIAGVGFVFLTFVIVGLDRGIAGVPPEDLFVLPLVMSIIILPFAVMIDGARVNRLYGVNHRQSVWGILSMIPFIGIFPALGWIWRRRKTEKAAKE